MDETFETVEFFFRNRQSFAATDLGAVGGVRTVQGGNYLPVRFKNMFAAPGSSDHESPVVGLRKYVIPSCPLRILEGGADRPPLARPLLSVTRPARPLIVRFIRAHPVVP